MRYLQRFGLALLGFSFACGLHAADAQPSVPEKVPLVWSSDYPAALKQSAKEGRPVLLDFTGSDWCIWCHRLDAEIFDQPAFREYAKQSLILVEVDFPRRKQLSKELITQNFSLQAEFRVEGYPTIVVVDSTGKELGRLGYMEGGAKTFVRSLQRLLKTGA
jgi:protein disulfide-isomerase